MVQSIATVCRPKLLPDDPMAQQQSYLLPIAIPRSIQQWKEASTVDCLNASMHGLDEPLGGTVSLLNDRKVDNGISFQQHP